MLWLLLGAWLAAGLLAAGECAYILLTSGPYWLRLDDFALAWMVYAAAAMAGMLVVTLLRRILPLLRGLWRGPLGALRAGFLIPSAVGLPALALLIFNDLHSLSSAVTIALLLGALLAAGFLIIALLRRPPRLAGAMVLGAGPLLVYLVVSQATGLQATAAGRKATAGFQGPVSSVCLLVLDTTRADHLSCYGYDRPTTPNLDRLASEGLLCRNAISAACWTPPGHISIFTGTYPSQHGNDGKPYAPDELQMITEILRPAGYYTIAMYNNMLAGRLMNLTQGFHRDLGLFHNAWVYPAWARLRRKLIQPDAGAQITFRITARTLAWFAARRIPLFLYINVLEAHMPYQQHAPYFEDFLGDLDPATISNLAQVQRFCASHRQVSVDSTFFAGYTPESFAYLAAAYDSEIAYLDHHIGGFADRLRRAGVLDDILLVVTADHGEFLGEHYTRGHPAVMLDPVLRIPLILRYPRLIAPGVLDAYVSNVDILPTVLGMLEIPEPEDAQISGIDIRNDDRLGSRVILSENIWPQTGCYSFWAWPYKLVANEHPGTARRLGDGWLFRLDDGTGEAHDLYAQSPETVRALRDSLDAITAALRVQPQAEYEMTPQMREGLRGLGYIN